MFYKITSLSTLDDYILLAGFSNGIFKKFDLKPIINKYPPFQDLINIKGLYKQARIDVGGYGIIFNDELDISSNAIFEKGEEVKQTYNIDLSKEEFINEFNRIRKEAGLSQKQLEVISGVSQPIIARIENNQTDPQLSTLIKLLEPLGQKLKIVDIKSFK